MRASKPAPAMTAKRSPLRRPTSMRRERPRRGRCRRPAPMSFGMPRFVASRFAVPAGMIATVASVPARTSTQRCTMPSPPHTKIRSALRASAFLTSLGSEAALPHLAPEDVRHAALARARGEARASRRRPSCRGGRSRRRGSCPLLGCGCSASGDAPSLRRRVRRTGRWPSAARPMRAPVAASIG